MQTATLSRLLNENEVSQLIGIQPKTLQRWRLEGRGPRYRKLGNAAARRSPVRYELRVIEEWVSQQAEGGGREAA